MSLIAPGGGRGAIAGSATLVLPKAAAALWALLAAALLLLLTAPLGDARAQEPPDRPVLLVDIKGAIGFVAAGQLAKALDRAAAQGAPALIVRIDTPGGLVS